jgi:6,7-dimethyl-8-ribityllumazine synthase
MQKTSGQSPDTALPQLPGKRVAIVEARFYPELVDQLSDGARRAAIACGIEEKNIQSFSVPGCFELPLAVKRIINADPKIDAIVALGIVVRGDTPHFDFVAGECSRGIMMVQLSTNIPVGFGILTTETVEQAEERADPKRGDKGFEAMVAALSVLAIEVKKTDSHIGFRG